MVSSTLIPNTGGKTAPEFIFVTAIVPRDYMKEKEDKIAKLQELCDVQCSDGNWNYSAYMFGMANGIIFSISVLTGEEPKFLEKPDFFITEIKELDKFNNSSIIVANNKTGTTDETD